MLWKQDKTETLTAVDDYIRARFIYTSEQMETLQTPEYMASGLEINHHLIGDCDDIATFHATLLTCLGYKVRFVAIKSVPNDMNYDHVYLEALNPDTKVWETFDATVPVNTVMEYHGKVEIVI